MKIVVVGAGLIGVTTAYFLARRGHVVHVVERRANVALETSHANGGQISISHPEPWASPDLPRNLLRWLGRADAPLRLRPRADPAMWRWLWSFLRNCSAQKRIRHAAWIAELALYSREALTELRSDTGIAFHHHRPGTLHVCVSARELEHAAALAELRRGLGIEQQVLDRDGCVRVEPALAEHADRLSGGIYAPIDEAGDAYRFTEALAQHCAGLGITFQFDTELTGIDQNGDRIAEMRTNRGPIHADRYVVAAGVHSARLVRPLGLRLPIYPVKGYSATVPVAALKHAPTTNIIYEAKRVVTSRLGSVLRIAGMADVAGYDDSLDERRARAVLDAALELFPVVSGPVDAHFWAGLRPMTPDGPPILGATPYRNLFLNCGHGSLGWTLACGSARAVADLLSNATPSIELSRYGAGRFA